MSKPKDRDCHCPLTPQPFTQEDFESLVTNFPNKLNTQELISHLLTSLKDNTTDYKLIAEATLLSSHTVTENKHTVGLLWDADTDGSYKVQLKLDEATLVVNIFYIKKI